MFTGIVEELGIVRSLAKTEAGARLTVESKTCASDIKKGDSISINGCCLTVAGVRGNLYPPPRWGEGKDEGAKFLSFDISSETLDRTLLGRLKTQDRVNLERSLRADSRLGGHFVTGHIDTAGKIVLKERQDGFIRIKIEIPEPFMVFLVEKGSIAVDGISLTINSVSDKSFTVLLIPHTLAVTGLAGKRAGDYVNIETDILAKYAQSFINRPSKKPTNPTSSLNKNFLAEHGFI